MEVATALRFLALAGRRFAIYASGPLESMPQIASFVARQDIGAKLTGDLWESEAKSQDSKLLMVSREAGCRAKRLTA